MIDGILNIYKEKGYTSHDVAAKLRGILKQKKTGHTGTLDPEAQGVLPVCLGRATKVCDLLSDQGKEYRATLRLGIVTDTQDMTGKLLSEAEVCCSPAEAADCIRSFVGRQQQIPPMYSALKVGGKKLYELARQGIEVERRPREIEIYDINIEEIHLPRITMTVSCSKGTYIRTLCHDIGQKLGCGGCMESLLRTKAGPFLLADSVRLAEVEELCRAGRLSEILIPTDHVFAGLRALALTPEGEHLARNGNRLVRAHVREVSVSAARNGAAGSFAPGECDPAAAQDNRDPGAREGEQFRIYGTDGDFLAVYEWKGSLRAFTPVKMFLPEGSARR